MNTKEKILNSALKLFVHNGFGTTTTAITNDAGVSSGILFHYFSTKADLIVSLYSLILFEYYQAGVIFIDTDGFSELTAFENNLKKAWKAQIQWGLDHWEKFQYLHLFENSSFLVKYEPQNNPKVQELELYIIRQTEFAISRKFTKDLPVKLIINIGKALTTSTINFFHESQPSDQYQKTLEEAWNIYYCALIR